MGYSLAQIFQAVYEPDNGLTCYERLVMLCLARHADKNGRCYPSIPLIARECGISESTARRAIKGLKAKRWLSVVRKDGEANTYTCTIPTPVTGTPLPERHPYQTDTPVTEKGDPYQRDRGPLSERQAPLSDRQGTPVRETPELNITNPIINSSYNVDVNIDVADQEMEEDDVRKVEEHFLRRRGKGLMLSPLDESEIRKLLDEGIPVDVILRGIDRAFSQYQPKYQGDGISSFRYCVPIIRSLWAELSRPKPTGTLIRGRGRGGRRYVKRDYENMAEQLQALAQRKPKPASAYLPDMWGNAAAGSGAQAAVDGQVGLL